MSMKKRQLGTDKQSAQWMKLHWAWTLMQRALLYVNIEQTKSHKDEIKDALQCGFPVGCDFLWRVEVERLDKAAAQAKQDGNDEHLVLMFRRIQGKVMQMESRKALNYSKLREWLGHPYGTGHGGTPALYRLWERCDTYWSSCHKGGGTMRKASADINGALDVTYSGRSISTDGTGPRATTSGGSLSAAAEPEEGSYGYLSKRIQFRDGELGIVTEPGSFEIKDVVPGGQADKAGVKPGWRFASIDGKPYTEQSLRAKLKVSGKFTITFDRPFPDKPGELISTFWTPPGGYDTGTEGGTSAWMESAGGITTGTGDEYFEKVD